MRRAYALLTEGYADWEIGHVLPELRRLGKREVVTVGFTDKTVESIGGIRVKPEMTLSQIDIKDVLIFILPGGLLWEQEYPASELEPFLQRLDKAKIPVAGICAATTVMAKAGLLNDRKHTSNSIKYMSKMVPGYAGHDNYVNSLAARDRRVITASGLGSVDFTMEILKELDIESPEMRNIWYEAFKHGNYPDDLEH